MTGEKMTGHRLVHYMLSPVRPTVRPSVRHTGVS